MSRHDPATAEDRDWSAHHNTCEEADDHRRMAREEGHGTAYDPTAPQEELTGGLWDQLSAAIAAARRSGQ